MGEPAFTPGPWRYEAGENPFFHSVTSDGGDIVYLTLRDVSAEANARLIAAAPALYEALLKVQRAFRERTLLNPHLPLDVDEALSLALGESPNA